MSSPGARKGFVPGATVHPIEVGAIKVGVIEVDPIKVGVSEVGPVKVGLFEIGPSEVGAFEIGVFKIGCFQVGASSVGRNSEAYCAKYGGYAGHMDVAITLVPPTHCLFGPHCRLGGWISNKTLGYLWPLVWRNTLRYCALRRILHNGDGLLPNYRRYRVAGGTYFFTVNLLERYPNDLLVRHIELPRGAVRQLGRAQ